MGLIKEPKGVDFYVIDKVWNDEERKEFSAFIKVRKKQLKKKIAETSVKAHRRDIHA